MSGNPVWEKAVKGKTGNKLNLNSAEIFSTQQNAGQYKTKEGLKGNSERAESNFCWDIFLTSRFFQNATGDQSQTIPTEMRTLELIKHSTEVCDLQITQILIS